MVLVDPNTTRGHHPLISIHEPIHGRVSVEQTKRDAHRRRSHGGALLEHVRRHRARRLREGGPETVLDGDGCPRSQCERTLII